MFLYCQFRGLWSSSNFKPLTTAFKLAHFQGKREKSGCYYKAPSVLSFTI